MKSFTALLLALVTASALRATDAWFVTPDAGVAVYGPIELAVHVETSYSVLAVEFFVDGKRVGVVKAPPYSLVHDMGYDNREHTLRAVARIAGGERVEIARRTGIFKVDDLVKVELRQLYVNVASGGGRVRDLKQGDFRIFDAGERQRIVTFEHGDIPMTAVLLLDCSASMEGERFGAALRGARTFLDRMAPLDEVKLLLFSDRLLGATPFTRDRELMEATLSSVEAVGGTAINDYLFAALKALDGRQGRRVVVLFTDGLDLHSLLTMQDVIWKAERSQAVVYWIFLREADEDSPPKFNTAWRGFEANLEEFNLLRRAVRQSGGRIAELDSADELEAAFAEIIAELRDQYVIGYYPHETRRDGSWREVDVRVRRLGAKLRTRQGYIDY